MECLEDQANRGLEAISFAQGVDYDYLTSYDPDSIMNYCNPRYNGWGELSSSDIVAVQQWYPRANAQTAPAPTRLWWHNNPTAFADLLQRAGLGSIFTPTPVAGSGDSSDGSDSDAGTDPNAGSDPIAGEDPYDNQDPYDQDPTAGR